jgi:diacylglycerol kinase family enzyme
VNVFWRYPMQVLRLRWEGRETLARTPFVLVGNNEYLIAAEGFGRRASLREGTLSAYYAPRVGRFRFLWNATKALFGFVRDGLDLEKIITGRLDVEARKHEVPAAVDGELRSFKPPLEFGVSPRALRVVVPRPPQ